MLKQGKFSLINVFVRMFKLAWQSFGCSRIFTGYAIVLTILSCVFGRWTYSCEVNTPAWWCYGLPSNTLFILLYLGAYFLSLLFLMFAFAYDLYKSAFQGKPFTAKDIITYSKEKLKAIGVMFGSLLAFCIPGAVAFYILTKAPNPNWKIEFIWFLITFTMCMIPLMALRLSAASGYYLANGHFPNIKVLFAKTTGKGYTPIFSLMFLVLAENLLHLNIMGILRAYNEQYNYFTTAALTEFFDNLFKLGYLAVIIANIRAQQELLYPAEPDETEAEAVKDEDEEGEKTEDKKTVKTIKTSKKKTAAKKQKSGRKKTTR